MAFDRIGVIFDDTVRRDTTGVYCLRALRRMAQIEHIRPGEFVKHPKARHQLYIAIDDGLDYVVPEHLRPLAVWAIDTHLDPERIITRCRPADIAVAAQRDGVEILNANGVNCVGWLPLGADLELHRRHNIAKKFDICFVGTPNCSQRNALFRLIREHFTNHYIGQAFFDEMAAVYSASCIVTNRSIRNDINMRVFESLACGSMLLTNDLANNGQEVLFKEGVHLATYRSTEEFVDKARFYLQREDLREEIAKAGMAEVSEKHTYGHRMHTLLEVAQQQFMRNLTQGVDVKTTEGGAGVELPPSISGLTSIVILTFNQVEYTRQCIESIRRHTHIPHELILVDNGSTDGTLAYLRELEGINLICNEVNRGFPAGANQGIRAARGSYILLLNNDTIVTEGWLDRLLNALNLHPELGLVGPRSNNVSGLQGIPTHYRDREGMEDFAANLAKSDAGVAQYVIRLTGFCLLFRRELVAQIGLLDERFGIGNYEDDDFCLRAIRAGYKAAIIHDSFVHHYGSTTFKGNGFDHQQILKRNKLLFDEKWRLSLKPGTEAEATSEPPQAAVDSAKISLCMIVRDSSKTLDSCLRSIRPWVDEIVVVDTGSQDNTIEIALSHGARVFEFPWCDSFSAARNESIRHATGEWIFWMDSDDTIDEFNGEKLRDLPLKSYSSSTFGFVIQVHCPGSENDEGVTVVDHVKLFRNIPVLRFEGRVHEQILPSIRAAKGEVEWTDIFVVHSGSDQTQRGRERKHQRDMQLLKQENDERPDHPFILFNMGMTYADMGQYEKALAALERSLQVSHPHDSQVPKLYALIATCHSKMGRRDLALDICARGLRACSDDPELFFRRAMLLYEFGFLEESARNYERILERSPVRKFSSRDSGICGYKARHNLALVYMDMQRSESAEQQWRRVLTERPMFLPAWSGIIESLLQQKRYDDASSILLQFKATSRTSGILAGLRGQVSFARGDLRSAESQLSLAVAEKNVHPETLRTFGRLLVENGNIQTAVNVMRRLIVIVPYDAAAYHSLASLLLQLGNQEEALSVCSEAIRLQPESVAAHQLKEKIRHRMSFEIDELASVGK